MGRIEINEKRLDDLNSIVSQIDIDLEIFQNSIKEYHLLNKYYGSKAWLKDKEDIESGKINNVKAGVLSEDAVWNLDENVSEIITRMETIIRELKY